MNKTSRLPGLGQIKKPDINRRIIFKIIKSALLVMLCTTLMMFAAFLYYIFNYLEPNIGIDLSSFNLKYTTSIKCKDSSGNWVEVEQLHSGENREWTPLSEIPLNMQNAVIAIEDERFRQHHGVDWKRTFGAAFELMTGHQSFGGSTITQQLIKNLTGEDTVGFTRKIEEILRALSIEKKYSKDEILEYYLNTLYLSEDIYGVKVAARSYFDKDISELSLAECASIAGITQYPGNYNPFLHPDRNKKRQEIILGKMLQLGLITQEEYDAAKAEQLVFKRGGKTSPNNTQNNGVQSYFTDQIVNDVLHDLMKKNGWSQQIANQQLFTKGWTIYSTMDIDIQNAIDSVFANQKNFPHFSGSVQPEASMIVIDPYTGAVLGMRGGREKKAARTLNRATQTTRSPGSTIKPIAIYGPAIEYGVITEASIYDDSPFNIETKYPRNYDVDTIGYTGLSTIRNAIQRSINTVAVKVLNDLGVERSFNFLKDNMHITSLKDGVNGDENISPLALGGMTNGITLEELVAAYQPFVNRGIYSQPYTYTKVVDADGKVILENKNNQSTPITEQTAFIMNDLLQSVVNGGTGSAAKIANMPTAGKTGTTSDNTDRLFVGYTPYYLGGVWFGYDTPKEINLSYNPALALWKKVMDIAHKGKAKKEFFSTNGLVEATFCMDSGERLTNTCSLDPRGSRTAKGWFKEGTEPKEQCDVHVPVKVDKTTNMIATDQCPADNVKTVGLLNYRREYPYFISIRDAQYTYLPLPADYIYPTDSMVPVYQNLLPVGFTAGQSPNAKNPMNHLCSTHTPQIKRDSYSEWKGYKITAAPKPSTPAVTQDTTPNTDTIPVTTIPN